MTKPPEPRICVAKITTAHGVRGLVKLKIYAEDIALIDGALFTEETGDNTITLTLKSATNKFWLAEIEGITDRTQAEKLRGTDLYVARSALPAPDEDEFYMNDLVGLKVTDETGAPIGEVIAVENFGASDLIEIQPNGADSFYLPFTDDTVIEITEDAMTVSIPDGLID